MGAPKSTWNYITRKKLPVFANNKKVVTAKIRNRL